MTCFCFTVLQRKTNQKGLSTVVTLHKYLSGATTQSNSSANKHCSHLRPFRFMGHVVFEGKIIYANFPEYF